MGQMAEPLHDFRFPGETNEYRRARDELLSSEIELRRQIERTAVQRRALPLGGAVQTDYVFEEWDADADAAREIRLSELFAPGKDTLFLYSFMVVPPEQGLPYVGPCPSCTSITDAVDGAVPHLTQRINFAVASKAPIAQFRQHGARRGWRHARLLSAAGNSYNRDYGAEDENGFQWPLATVFVRRDGQIHHAWSSELFFAAPDPGEHSRHVDFMWPMWLMFDHTPVGRGSDWYPALEYG
jgi:predicted dithiol-disulfide oxidoreductase (DUF899 family)